MNKLISATALITLLAIAGCHTVQGAGKDIQRAGEKGQETIDPAGQK